MWRWGERPQGGSRGGLCDSGPACRLGGGAEPSGAARWWCRCSCGAAQIWAGLPADPAARRGRPGVGLPPPEPNPPPPHLPPPAPASWRGRAAGWPRGGERNLGSRPSSRVVLGGAPRRSVPRLEAGGWRRRGGGGEGGDSVSRLPTTSPRVGISQSAAVLSAGRPLGSSGDQSTVTCNLPVPQSWAAFLMLEWGG